MTATFIVLLALGLLVLGILIGATITWLAGKMLHLDELNFPNSAGLELLFLVVNPCMPMAFFFLDYYLGINFGTSNPIDSNSRIYLGMASAIISIILWLALYKYIFEWDFKSSCSFCVAKSCLGGAAIVVLAIGLVFVILKTQGNKPGAASPNDDLEMVSPSPESAPSSQPVAPPPSRPSGVDEKGGVIVPTEKQKSDSGVIKPTEKQRSNSGVIKPRPPAGGQ